MRAHGAGAVRRRLPFLKGLGGLQSISDQPLRAWFHECLLAGQAAFLKYTRGERQPAIPLIQAAPWLVRKGIGCVPAEGPTAALRRPCVRITGKGMDIRPAGKFAHKGPPGAKNKTLTLLARLRQTCGWWKPASRDPATPAPGVALPHQARITLAAGWQSDLGSHAGYRTRQAIHRDQRSWAVRELLLCFLLGLRRE
jgi:hypothetical protein